MHIALTANNRATSRDHKVKDKQYYPHIYTRFYLQKTFSLHNKYPFILCFLYIPTYTFQFEMAKTRHVNDMPKLPYLKISLRVPCNLSKIYFTI